VGAEMRWQMAKDKRFILNAAREDWWPQGDDFTNQERTVHSVGLTYEHDIMDGLTAGATVKESWYDYTSRSRPDVNLLDYSAFVRFGKGEAGQLRLTQRSTLTLGVGVSSAATSGGEATSASTTNVTTSSDSTQNDETAITGNATLETMLRKDLTHRLSYSRGLRAGFDTAVEQYDHVSYRLNWQGKVTRATFTSSMSSVDPMLATDIAYRDWANQVQVARDVTDWMTVTLTSSYTVRDNLVNASSDLTNAAEEDTSDYSTWVTRIGTDFRLTKRVTFNTYAEHVERFSDNPDLAYSRETFAAYLTYQQRF